MSGEAGKNSAPFIFWTLQRTGGTNLFAALSEISPWKVVQHEPFNVERLYGCLTQGFSKSKDEEALGAGMDAILSDRINIKHCVELVPPPVSKALIKSSANLGYRHVFLYRRNRINRMLSREFARRTNIWGPKHGRSAEDIQLAFEAPLNVKEMLENERKCAQRLNRCWKMLQCRGHRPFALAFEQIFDADQADVEKVLANILKHLSLFEDSDQAQQLLSKLSTGDQQTSNKYASFPDIDELEKEMATLPEFIFDEQMKT